MTETIVYEGSQTSLKLTACGDAKRVARLTGRSMLLTFMTLASLTTSCLLGASGASAQSMQFDSPAYGQPAEGVTQQNLNEALSAYKRGDFLRSSLLLFDIIKDKETATNTIDEQADEVPAD